MAQKQEQYEGAADSIFNFIFSFNKKDAPLKPMKPIKGVHGNEMAYALGEIASAPAIYAAEEALNVINEPLDKVGLAGAKIKLDGENVVKVGVSLKNASDFFNDPDGFIDKAFERAEGNKKAAKRLNMIRGIGGVMDLGIGAVAARSLGSSSINSLEMGSVLGSESLGSNYRDAKAEELATRTSALEAAKLRGLNYNEANKQAQIFTSVMESSRLDLAGKKIGQAEKKILTQKLQRRGITDQTQINTLLDKYIEKAELYKQDKGYDWELGSLDKRTTEERPKGPNQLENWRKSENPADKLRALKFEELEAEIAFYSHLPNTDPKKLQLIGQRDHIKTWQLANSHKMRWSSYFGEAATNIQHFNELVIQGGAFPALISGDFFDKRKNNMTPSEEKDIWINGQEFKGINVARDDQRAFYTRINNLYYFTPASIGKTLFVNGEGFTYFFGHLRQEKIRKKIMASDTLFAYVTTNSGKFGADFFKGIDMSNQSEVLSILALNENYTELLKVLGGDLGSISDPKLLELFKQIEKIQSKIKGSVALKYAEWINKRFGNILRIKEKLSLHGLIGLILGKKLADKAKKYLIGGQVALRKLARSLAKKGVHALAQALGFATTGGLANILIYVATEAIYFVAEKLLKPIVKAAALVAWSIGVILVVVLFGVINFLSPLNMFSSKAKTFNTAGNAAPIFCEECGGSGIYGELPDDYDSDGGGSGAGDGAGGVDSGGSPSPAYSDADCPLGTGSINCTQAPYTGISHGSRNAIDVTPPPTTWYAPSDGVVTRVSPPYTRKLTGTYSGRTQLCGGIVHFYSPEHDVTYQLVHVRTNLSQGDNVSKGQLVVNMSLEGDGTINFIPYRDSNGNKTSTCATGAHFHLELSGTSVYADRYYAEFLGCKINACPGRPQFEPKEIEASDEFKTFTGSQFVALGDSAIGVSSSSTKPHITGNQQADKIIQGIAENRGYKLRRDAGSANSSATSAYGLMAKAIKDETGLDLRNVSHYRTVARQRELFLGDLSASSANCEDNNYANIINRTCDSDINGILRTRSIPGYSKHHTGYAIDFGCNSNDLTGFGRTACYTWLSKDNYYNAKRFGFIPSYPAGGGNQGPDPEEWEYLWVGVDKLK